MTAQKMPTMVPHSVEFGVQMRPKECELQEADSIVDMARMAGLSRSRVRQLIGTALPYPVYSVETRRPFYDEQAQKLCLDVRRRNCGIDGKPVLFYARYAPRAISKRRGSNVQKLNPELLDGLK